MKKSVLLEFEEYEKLVEENKRLTKIAEDRTSVLEVRDCYIYHWDGVNIAFSNRALTYKGKKEFEKIVTEIHNKFVEDISERLNKEAFNKLESIKSKRWYKFFGE